MYKVSEHGSTDSACDSLFDGTKLRSFGLQMIRYLHHIIPTTSGRRGGEGSAPDVGEPQLVGGVHVQAKQLDDAGRHEVDVRHAGRIDELGIGGEAAVHALQR